MEKLRIMTETEYDTAVDKLKELGYKRTHTLIDAAPDFSAKNHKYGELWAKNNEDFWLNSNTFNKLPE